MSSSLFQVNTKYKSWVEIDLDAVAQNFDQINLLALKNSECGEMKKVEVMSVVKADAYGHGMLEVSRRIQSQGGLYFAVSDLQEGIALRDEGITGHILVIEGASPEQADDLIVYRLTPTVSNLDLAAALQAVARERQALIDIHVNIDTGMGRMGVWWEEAEEFISKLRHMNNLVLKGVYTHFPMADIDGDYTDDQVERFRNIVQQLENRMVMIPDVHAANSAGLAGYSNRMFNIVRPGLMLYGLYPTELVRDEVSLMPAMSVHSRVIHVKSLSAGQGVSYGHTFVTQRPTQVATIPVGYQDGYFRCLGNKAFVLIHGQRCPVIGRVTMDQTMIDVTDVPGVCPGAPVVLLGSQKDEVITADDLAHWAGTINYEIVCSLGRSLPKIHRGEC